MVGTDVRLEAMTPFRAVLEALVLSGAAATPVVCKDGITEPAVGTVALVENEVSSDEVLVEAVVD